MANDKTTETANDAASKVENAGRSAGAQAAQAGSRVGGAIDDAAEQTARRIRSGGQRASAAYDDAMGGVDHRVASLEDTIRQNPLASAGAALLIGVVLGRFIL